MPKDQRLYMTFPNDFWMHPKIHPLSDAAFRAFVELNGYSRMQDTDGRVPVAAAKKLWRGRPLSELLANHPERPSLTVDGDDYVIWNYGEHQQTKAERDERSAINTANGVKGGRPRGNRTKTESVSEIEPNQKQSQSQSLEIELLTLGQSSTEVTASVDMTLIIDSVRRFCDRDCSQVDAYRIVGTVLQRAADSGTEVKHAAAYVMGSIQKEPEVFQKLLDDARGTVSGIQTPDQCKPHGYPKGMCPTCDLAVAS